MECAVLDFSIIIPTANRPDLLGKCIEAVQQCTVSFKEKLEIIISDDSESANINEEVREKYPYVHWLNGPRKGPAANRNHAAKNARGTWLLFLDDDCIPSDEWFIAYHSAILNNIEAKVFEGKTLAFGKREKFNQVAPVNENGGNLWSCNFLIQNDLFKALNGFDDTFPYPAMEDVDFCMRIKQRERIVFVPNAIVFHPWRDVKAFTMFQKHLKSHILLSHKHGLHGSISYRWGRIKIFVGHTISDFKMLNKFSYRGTLTYWENIILNFLLIFA